MTFNEARQLKICRAGAIGQAVARKMTESDQRLHAAEMAIRLHWPQNTGLDWPQTAGFCWPLTTGAGWPTDCRDVTVHAVRSTHADAQQGIKRIKRDRKTASNRQTCREGRGDQIYTKTHICKIIIHVLLGGLRRKTKGIDRQTDTHTDVDTQLSTITRWSTHGA